MKNQTHTTAKKTAGVVLNVILWLFVIFCVAITVVAFSANGNAKGVPTVGGKCFLNVQSGSMSGDTPSYVPEGKPAGFPTGAMIIGRYIAGDSAAIDALEVGDIVTFEWDINGDGVRSPGEYNTHRIVAIERDSAGAVVRVTTQGDNPEYSKGKTEVSDRSALIAMYTGKRVDGLGGVMTFLSSQLGFGLCILLPLLLFFIYEIIVFVRTLMSVRNADKKLITAEDEEQIRKAAIEEYLRLHGGDVKSTDAPSDNENENKNK